MDNLDGEGRRRGDGSDVVCEEDSSGGALSEDFESSDGVEIENLRR